MGLFCDGSDPDAAAFVHPHHLQDQVLPVLVAQGQQDPAAALEFLRQAGDLSLVVRHGRTSIWFISLNYYTI